MSGTENRFLCFRLDNENYGAPLLDVKEVLGIPEITTVPHVPNYFLGIMNLRGQVISVIDLRLKFGLKANRSPETCIVIFEYPGYCVGVVVDEVKSVLSVQPGDQKPPPDLANGKKNEYLTGIINRENEMIITLDISRALDLKDQSISKNLQKSA